MTTYPDFVEENCENKHQPIEKGTEESWRYLLATDKGQWIVARIGKELGVANTVYGGMRWTMRQKAPGYWVIEMQRSTMRRRIYYTIDSIRTQLCLKFLPSGEPRRECWYKYMLMEIVQAKNAEFYNIWGNRWLPYYEIKTVEFVKHHYLYVEGLTKRSKRKWRTRDFDLKELWDKYVEQQMYGVYGVKASTWQP